MTRAVARSSTERSMAARAVRPDLDDKSRLAVPAKAVGGTHRADDSARLAGLPARAATGAAADDRGSSDSLGRDPQQFLYLRPESGLLRYQGTGRRDRGAVEHHLGHRRGPEALRDQIIFASGGRSDAGWAPAVRLDPAGRFRPTSASIRDAGPEAVVDRRRSPLLLDRAAITSGSRSSPTGPR